MATSVDEITSDPPQPDLSTSDPRHCRILSRRLDAYCSSQEGGLPSDHARRLKVGLHPTGEELAEISDGRDPRRLIEDRYNSILRRQQLRRTGSVSALRQHAFVVVENDDGHLPGCICEGGICGWQSNPLQALGGCHGSILLEPRRIPGGHRSELKSSTARARPCCLPWPHSCDLAERVCPREVKNRMRDHVSRGEFDVHADEYTVINILGVGETCVPPARSHRPHGISGEGTSTMHNPVFHGASPSGNFDSLAHELAGSIPLQGSRWSSDGTAKSPESAYERETWGLQFPQARGGHRPNHLKLKAVIGGDGSGLRNSVMKARPHGSLKYDVTTMWNVSGEGTSTMVSSGASPNHEFDGFAHEHIDIEMGGTRSVDQTQQVHSRPRWTILGDSLLDVIVQGPFALVGLKTNHASSPAKDALVRVLVIVYTVGFLSAFGGKLIGSSKLGGIGSAAAVLGFLVTMALLLL